jgi:hypothetical protein
MQNLVQAKIIHVCITSKIREIIRVILSSRFRECAVFVIFLERELSSSNFVMLDSCAMWFKLSMLSISMVPMLQ